ATSGAEAAVGPGRRPGLGLCLTNPALLSLLSQATSTARPETNRRIVVDVLHTTEVTPDQIDHLGHMNVRYYATNARAGAERLLATLGLVRARERTVVQRDTSVRHHREQLVGSRLAVRGGVLDASPDRIRLYEELANIETGDIAATFVLTFEAAAAATRTP